MAVTSRPRAGTGTNVASKKGKKGKKGKAAQSPTETTQGGANSKGPTPSSWGPLEPIRSLLGPVGDILQPVLGGNLMYGLVLGLVISWWFGFGLAPGSSSGKRGVIPTAERIMAYEETWLREESHLWEWLDERVGLERLNTESARPTKKKKPMESRTVEARLAEGRIQEREVEEAIKVTEEKLQILKDVVGKTGGGGGGGGGTGGLKEAPRKDSRSEL
jgi:hypothetical protein